MKKTTTITINKEIVKTVCTKYAELAKNICNVYPWDYRYVLAFISLESNGIESARRLEPGYYTKYLSDATKTWLLTYGINIVNFGSYGLMQVLPSTVMNYDYWTNYDSFFEKTKNISAGAKYFNDRIRYAKTIDPNNYIELAVQYYNTGSKLNATYLAYWKAYYAEVIKNAGPY